MRVVPLEAQRVVPWANGLGTTRVVFEDEEPWSWRLSVAAVVSDGPFSVFPGVDRIITVIEGAGMALDVDGVVTDLRRHVPFRFAGEATTTATLVAGPVRDLNLMTRRSRWRGEVRIVDIVTPGPVAATALVVLRGRVRIDGEAVGAGGAVIEPGGSIVFPQPSAVLAAVTVRAH